MFNLNDFLLFNRNDRLVRGIISKCGMVAMIRNVAYASLRLSVKPSTFKNKKKLFTALKSIVFYAVMVANIQTNVFLLSPKTNFPVSYKKN